MAERILSLLPQLQTTDYWCWATVASVLSRGYNHAMSQCQIAGSYLNKDCCTNAALCFQPADLNRVLRHFEFSNENDYMGKEISFEYLKYEIDRNKPVAIRIMNNRFNHYVLLIGYSEMSATKTVSVIDPRLGTISSKHFENLAAAIYPESEWTHTYLLHPVL
jgi:hypothetical protein